MHHWQVSEKVCLDMLQQKPFDLKKRNRENYHHGLCLQAANQVHDSEEQRSSIIEVLHKVGILVIWPKTIWPTMRGERERERERERE